MTWINVNDKLPQYEIDILFVDKWDVIHKGYLSQFTTDTKGNARFLTYDTSDRFFGLESCDGVTHWMPLPELPTK